MALNERSFLQRRVVAPVRNQLMQGISPDALAFAAAIGATVGVMPFIGLCTVLCIGIGMVWRLNHVMLQLANYVVYPLQFLFLVPYWRAGEWLGAPELTLSASALAGRFEEAPIDFLQNFAYIVIAGVGVWIVTAPLMVMLIYYSLRPILRGAARRAPRKAV